MADWVDLHHHSGFSLLDGYGSVLDHMKRAAELGHRAVAFTEHGTARGFVSMHNAAKVTGVKPIYGLEFYVCRDHTVTGLTEEQRASVTAGLKGREATAAAKELERGLGLNERRHLCVVAEHDEGLRNIMRLNNIANTRGYYYKPRIDVDLLERHREGLWASSACLGGVLAKSWLEGDLDRLVNDALDLHEILEGRFSLEIQPHPIPEQQGWNKMAVKLHRKLGIPLVVTNDSHYIRAADHLTHDTLITLGHGRLLSDPDRIRYVQESFAIKSEEDLVEAFKRNHPEIPLAYVQQGIERAAMIGELCDAKIHEPKGVLLPALKIEEATPDLELRELCFEGWDWRRVSHRETGFTEREYLARLKHELTVIRDMEFAPYFLIIHEMLNWARSNDIMVGPGRGSAAGSLVCYLLGITAIDPLEHGLLFERFLTPGRADWPDVDCDVERDRRGEVFDHLVDLYGEGQVAQIGTISKMRGRSALRDVARVHGVPLAEVEKVVSSIVGGLARSDGEASIAEALHTTPALSEFAKRRPRVIEDTLALEGHIRHVGIHAAGVICSPVPLADLVPLERRSSKGEVKSVIGYDMRDCEQVGLIKIDLLGLKTLSILADAQRLIESRTGERLDLETLPLDDKVTLRHFTERDFSGVFQFDSPSARAACRGVEFNNFGEITAMNAINRPGPSQSGLADEWRTLKAKGSTKTLHPIVDRICGDTLGVIVYQEHIIRILQELAGFTPQEAGRLRKAISKSKGVGALEVERPAFVDGAVAQGMSRREADTLWTQIEQFGQYGFNKSHAAAYSAIAYWCMWLKVHHPLEMFAALLMNETDVGVSGRYVREAARRGITIDPPNVNTSGAKWSVRGGHILSGLGDIKGVGINACKELIRAQPFSSFSDILARVNRRVVNRGIISKLAKAGALSDIVPNPRWLIENIELGVLKKIEKSKGWMGKVDSVIADSGSEPQWGSEDSWAQAIEVGVHGRGDHPLGVLKTIDEELLRPDWGNLTDPKDGDLVRGIITTRKVGTGKGKRYASIELEDELGAKLRLRFGDKAYNANRHVLDLGVGAVVAARISKDRNGNFRCPILYDLLGIRHRWLNDEELEYGELILSREMHPANEARKGKLTRPDWAFSKGEEFAVIAVAKSVRSSSSGRWMGFASFDAGIGPAVEAVVFPDLWDEVGGLIVGDLVRVALAPDPKRGGWICKKLGVLST